MVRCLLILLLAGCAQAQVATPTDPIKGTASSLYVVSDSLIGGQDRVDFVELGFKKLPIISDVGIAIEKWYGGNWPNSPSKDDKEHFKSGSMKRAVLIYNSDEGKAVFYPGEIGEKEALRRVKETTDFVEKK